ncbi:hypothetical protein PHYBOEH_004491 [Phytophthora boehmeriae]|uniref:FYVE-type domain-containing protein n=1 Tax=Phytophthora boehmeriae TaxID=109152 RepID=A0A8T1WT09_9STRA|nr:hypothetical protein PHYBOEH_004491 [Phytophthora boehmeriae]
MLSMDDNYPPRPLHLSATDASALEELADQLVAETLKANDDLISQGRVVDATRWKALKTKNNVTAYRARKRASSGFRRERIASDMTEAVPASPQMPKLYDNHPSATYLDDESDDEFQDDYSFGSFSEQNVLEKYRPSCVPLVISTGVIPGTIEDAGLGFFADTEARSRMRHASNKDIVADDVRVLARIHGPTQDDPFRFLGVKWCGHTNPGAVGRFIKARDYVNIESTGMALDADGNRFYYMLIHTIDLDKVPDYRKFGYVRMTFSSCHIMRPTCTEGQIELFSRGFMDTGGKVAERLCTYMYCDGLMGMPLTIEEAYTMKLIWLLRTQHSCGTSSICPDSSDTCQVCDHKLTSGLAKLLESSLTCYLCRQTMCRKCTLKKTLPLDIDNSGQVVEKTMDFCVSCYLEAKNTSAWEVAMDMLSMNEQE